MPQQPARSYLEHELAVLRDALSKAGAPLYQGAQWVVLQADDGIKSLIPEEAYKQLFGDVKVIVGAGYVKNFLTFGFDATKFANLARTGQLKNVITEGIPWDQDGKSCAFVIGYVFVGERKGDAPRELTFFTNVGAGIPFFDLNYNLSQAKNETGFGFDLSPGFIYYSYTPALDKGFLLFIPGIGSLRMHKGGLIAVGAQFGTRYVTLGMKHPALAPITDLFIEDAKREYQACRQVENVAGRPEFGYSNPVCEVKR